MAKIYLKVRRSQPQRLGDFIPKPTWFVINSLDPDFEPHDCSWPHLIRFEPYTTNVGHVVTEADCERSARSYAKHVATSRPDQYEFVA
jgi:hypothetical protein